VCLIIVFDFCFGFLWTFVVAVWIYCGFVVGPCFLGVFLCSCVFVYFCPVSFVCYVFSCFLFVWICCGVVAFCVFFVLCVIVYVFVFLCLCLFCVCVSVSLCVLFFGCLCFWLFSQFL